jgi:DNA invertase Pin-like site-specific DNA recombinase
MRRSGVTGTRRIERVRCAIYTRKSSEEGLEQEFNSLQAQREACEAFINSQRHEGWLCVPQAYDDGGFSGATMERPALQRLLVDIAAGRVDTVVVYKIDRLTRSLADFAKIVEILDQRSASFVSVTQQFNTTTSMGRLTLNVLLSFAQFEREVIGERIRDKIAASKRKGMWMGGVPPLGYRVEDRKLRIIDSEAEIVRAIFRRYAELGSVRLVKEELDARGIKSKSWTSASGRPIGGKPFSRGALYLMLQNRTYLSEIVHKGQSHPGDHAPIIDQPLWDAAQSRLADNTAERSSGTRTRQPSLLAGILFDPDDNPHDPDPRRQECHTLPLLCLPLTDHQGSERAVTRAAPSSRRDRASGYEPGVQMASRPRQHLHRDTISRCVSAAPAHCASRGNRQELARGATTTPARRRYDAHRAHRRRKRPNRHPYPPEMVWRVARWGLDTIAERDG